MAITVIDQPQVISPAYNANYWYFDSTNKNEQSFRYVVSIFNGVELLGRYNLRPIPVTQYGEVDVSKVLQQALSESFDPSLIKSVAALEQRLIYDIKVDEKFIVSEDFTDYGFGASVANGGTWPNGDDLSINPNGLSRTMLIYSSEPLFEQGDVINVTQSGTANFRPELEGIHTVLDKYEIAGTWYLVLDLTWIGSGAAESGTTIFADNRESIFEGITISTKKAYRGAIPFNQYNTYNASKYSLIDTTSKLLTTLPTGVRISRNKSTYLKCYNATGGEIYAVFTIGVNRYRYSITAVTVNEFYLFNTLPSTSNIEEVFDGTSWVAFTGTIDLSDVTQYNLYISDNTGNVSKTYTIALYSECDLYDTYDITFLDRLGSWITLSFNKADYLTQNVERSEIRQKYGGLTESTWGYSAMDRGLKSYHTEENIAYKVYSDQMSESEMLYMKELVSSPSVYVSINGESYESINITSTNFNLLKKRSARNRIPFITFTKSVQDNING